MAAAPAAERTPAAEREREEAASGQLVRLGSEGIVHVSDSLCFSVTSPAAVVPGASFVVDVWAHLEHERDQVIERAREELAGEEIRTKTRGPVDVARDDVLVVHLDFTELAVERPEDAITWKGAMTNAEFAVQVPVEATEGSKAGVATIYVGGLSIMKLHFAVLVAARVGEIEPVPVRDDRYRSAFASYASADRNAVLARVQGMQAAVPDLDVFLDVLSLRSGQKWQHELQRQIDGSDVFYLFWSDHARRSEWVTKEWHWALEARGLDFIAPVPLVPPDRVPPPPELAAKHFNDWTLAFKRAPGH